MESPNIKYEFECSICSKELEVYSYMLSMIETAETNNPTYCVRIRTCKNCEKNNIRSAIGKMAEEILEVPK